eukprot:3762590-Prymnesium_polylepis.2
MAPPEDCRGGLVVCERARQRRGRAQGGRGRSPCDQKAVVDDGRVPAAPVVDRARVVHARRHAVLVQDLRAAPQPRVQCKRPGQSLLDRRSRGLVRWPVAALHVEYGRRRRLERPVRSHLDYPLEGAPAALLDYFDVTAARCRRLPLGVIAQQVGEERLLAPRLTCIARPLVVACVDQPRAKALDRLLARRRATSALHQSRGQGILIVRHRVHVACRQTPGGECGVRRLNLRAGPDHRDENVKARPRLGAHQRTRKSRLLPPVHQQVLRRCRAELAGKAEGDGERRAVGHAG